MYAVLPLNKVKFKVRIKQTLKSFEIGGVRVERHFFFDSLCIYYTNLKWMQHKFIFDCEMEQSFLSIVFMEKKSRKKNVFIRRFRHGQIVDNEK